MGGPPINRVVRLLGHLRMIVSPRRPARLALDLVKGSAPPLRPTKTPSTGQHCGVGLPAANRA
jgi:hypothetical protein